MRNINLLPVNHRPQPKFDFKSFAIVLVSSLAITILIFGVTYIQLSIRSTNRLINSIETNVNFLESNLEELGEEKQRLENIESIVSTIEDIENLKDSYVEILDEIEEFTPDGMTVTSLNISDAGVNIQAEAQELSLISTFIDSLDGWEYSSGVSISGISSSNERFFFGVQVSKWRSE